MNWIRSMLVAAFLVQIVYLPCAAQEAVTLLKVTPGARVRITAPSVFASQFIGEVVRVSTDTLVVTAEWKRLEVPFASVKRLDVSKGKKRQVGKGARVGARVGALGGLLFGALQVNSPGQFTPHVALVLGTIGAFYGLVIGAAIGATIKTESWEPMSLDRIRASMAPQCHGGVALSASVAF